MIRYIVLLIGLMFTATAQPVGDVVHGYLVTIRFESTSDWAELEFPNAPRETIILGDSILGSPDHRYTYYGIYKPQDTSYAGIEYYILLPSIPDTGLFIHSTKGAWGRVAITWTVRCPGADSSVVFVNKTNSGATNDQVFRVLPSLFHCNPQSITLPPAAEKPMVLAFYYPWYGNPQVTGYWFHWDPQNNYASADTPLLGYYDSNENRIIRQHVSWAKQYGVDGFILSWWGRGAFENAAAPRIFSVADTAGFPLSFYYEPSNIGSIPKDKRAARCIDDLRYLIAMYGNRPAMLRHNGKPLLFIYGETLALLPLTDWKTVADSIDAVLLADSFGPGVLDIFEGWHQYNTAFINRDFLCLRNNHVSVTARLRRKLFAATVVPGYDDRIIRTPGSYAPRNNGETYRDQWSAICSKPDFVLITSWNEWHEGTEIEPSQEYGFTYLELTRKLRDSIVTSSGKNERAMHWDLTFDIYPNPVNSSANIEFTLPQRDRVVLKLYSVLGREVLTLFEGEVDEGSRIVPLNMSFGNRTSLPNGTYFLRLQSSYSARTKTVFLLR